MTPSCRNTRNQRLRRPGALHRPVGVTTGVGVGTLDLFHDEAVDYARRLESSGVACQLAVVEGAFHGFDGFAPDAPVSQTYRANQINALRNALDPG